VLTGHKLQVAQELHASGQYTVTAIATTLGVSRFSIYRHLDRAGGRPTRRSADVANCHVERPVMCAFGALILNDRQPTPTRTRQISRREWCEECILPCREESTR
jgi:hypothetical protein